MGKKLLALFFLLASTCSFASLTLHVQSPWRNDASKAGQSLHITGAVTDFIAQTGANSKTMMTDEGDGWFSYTWNKNISDYEGWETFEISIYPNVANGKGEKWEKAGEIKFNSLFEDEKELWLYTNPSNMTYTVSLIAPGSKIVWFKSPWGNKALPDLILGRDTLVMHFKPDDKSTCGWFYGAISPAVMKRNPLQSAYFMRHLTPYMTFPEKGLVELGTHLSSHDTVFVDGTASTAKITYAIGSLGTCFDSTRVLHVFHPWRMNSSYRDKAIYIKVWGLSSGRTNLGEYTAMSNKGEYPYWYYYSFSPSFAALDQWKSTSAHVNIRRYDRWPEVSYFEENQGPLISSLFPKDVYESWLYTSSNGKYEVVFTPQEPKVIRLMSPWDNATPSMIVDNDTLKMAPVGTDRYDSTQTDTCGWYTVSYYKHMDSWDVHFKQTFGFDKYSLEGIMGQGKGFGTPISLDSMMALHDTVWIYPYPLASSGPKFSEKFPGRLGICPTMTISAMVVDWAGESYDDSIDVDFGGIYNGNAYTTITYKDSSGKTITRKACSSGDVVKGMVKETLVNGNPARVDSALYPWDKCPAAHEIERWFVPEVVATDKNGKKYTNAVCRDISLKLDEEGFWLADITNNKGDCNDPVNPGFYPIDDLEYLDSAKTVKNPKFDWNVNKCMHNYSFAMKISATFRYIKGQYFEFRGDDDVWVFINNRLVVDIGGCHDPKEGAVDLDSLGLTEGKEYPFHIFFSERNAIGSNFKMRTSINLQTRKTYFPIEKPNNKGLIEYELKQLLMDESLSCDVSSTAKVDTTLAQSIFRLTGGSLPMEGVFLDPGLNYGGIYINENMAGFWIDTTAFVNSRTLAPGNYVLMCFLASDVTQSQIIRFTVPEYPLPNIAFMNVFHLSDSLFMDTKGLTLRGDSLGAEGGKNDTLWAYAAYPDTVPLQIALVFGNTPCGKLDDLTNINCREKLTFQTKFPISFVDEKFQLIDTLVTDSAGYAKFYVVGDSAMVNAYFTISGTGVGNQLVWREIHFKEPPVPIVRKAQMFDVDGNGVPDSLVMRFSKAFEDVVPDTLMWIFGGDEEHKISSMKNVWPLVKNDSILVLYDKNGLRSDVFTGATDKVYSGTLAYHYTYIDEDSGNEVKLMLRTNIDDKVAPIIRSATVQTVSENVSMVVINLSEGSDLEKLNPESTFVFYRGVLNFMDSLRITGGDIRSNGNVAKVYFQRSSAGILPMVGDSVRLAPGVFEDRSGNKAHLKNPKVRIEGEQRTEIKSPGVINISNDLEKWPYKESVVAVSVPSDMSIHDVIDSLGMPGFLLSFNLGELATTVLANLPSGADVDSALATIKIVWEDYYYSHLGNYVTRAKGTVRCNDKDVFYNASNPSKSNCFDNPGNVFFEWNARSDDGRLVGTGPYISKLRVKVYSGRSLQGKNEDVYTLGIRRGK